MVIMNIHHVALVFLCAWCVCVCEISNTVRIVANQTTQNPGNCSLSMCPDGVCTRVLYSGKDFTCIYLNCDNETACDLFVAKLGRKTREEEQSNRADPLQPSFPHTAPPTTFAAPSSAPLSRSESDGNQHFNSKNSSDSGFSNNTSRYSQEENPGQNQTQTGQNRGPGQNQTQTGQNGDTGQNQTQTGQNGDTGQNQTQTGQNGDTGQNQTQTGQNGDTGQNQTQTGQNGGQKQVLNGSTQNEDLGQGQNNTLQNEPQGQTLNNLLQNGHQGQPSIQPSTPEPPPSPVSVASEGAGNILSSVPEKNRTRVNKTEQETTTSSSSTSPAPPTNSTTATNTTVTMTTVTTNTIGTNHKHTSPPNTTATLLTSTPPPTHLFPSSSHTPAVLPSITPSTPPPRTRASTAPPRVPEVTSDQGKGVEETAGGELTNRFINTNSLIAVLIFGLLFFIVTIVLFLRHAYESYKRRGYTQMDYLINGMYSDSGL